MALKPGTSLKSAGGTITINHLLGEGGQGAVYAVSAGSETYALKWYHPQCCTPHQRQAIASLVAKRPPSSAFLWPRLLVEDEQGGFGYAMDLRPTGYQDFTALMAGRISPSFRALAKSMRLIAEGFKNLHALGLCYCDISWGNLFIRELDGDILICDNDNVTTNGNPNVQVSGTPMFMAPEIVCGRAGPSADTDRHSLAILLFTMWCMHHPYHGRLEAQIRCWDLPAQRRIYGDEALFIFDPNDNRNAPNPADPSHLNPLIYWSLLPTFLKDLFIRAFGPGRSDIHARIRESEWRDAAGRLVDSIFPCAACGAELFWDAPTSSPTSCWSCKGAVAKPMRLSLPGTEIVLGADTRLGRRHLEQSDVPGPALAEVVRHPQQPGRWGLANRSGGAWILTRPDGSTQPVDDGKTAPLVPGNQIDFGKIKGTIVH